MRNSLRKGVVEIEHVPRGGGEGDVGDEVGARRTYGSGGALTCPRARTCQPVGEGCEVGGVCVHGGVPAGMLRAHAQRPSLPPSSRCSAWGSTSKLAIPCARRRCCAH